MYIKKEVLNFASSSMWGWRPLMDESYLEEPCVNNDHYLSVFGIFDGHGGILLI